MRKFFNQYAGNDLPPLSGTYYYFCMDIFTLDLNFQNIPRSIASYLVVGPSGAILVETGPASTLETLKSELASHGYQLSDLAGVLLTHIHLDHAGAAGWVAQEGVPLYVHDVGAPHLIDPSKLLASAGRIYGDQMGPLWGKTVAAPEELVSAVADGDIVKVAGLEFKAINTPGHAWHHHTWRLGDIGFTGDAAGICVAGIDYIDVPAPPPEFKLEVWLATIKRLRSERFEAIYPTHFGRVEAVERQLVSLREKMLASAEFVRDRLVDGADRDTLLADYLIWNEEMMRAAGLGDMEITIYDKANPLYMSVDGLIRYWTKKWAKEQKQ